MGKMRKNISTILKEDNLEGVAKNLGGIVEVGIECEGLPKIS